MRPHQNLHAIVRLPGQIPRAFMVEQRLSQCQVCASVLASTHGNACPRCRPVQGTTFDSTLGFPGEGPCRLCGDLSHKMRTCPHVPADVSGDGSGRAQPYDVLDGASAGIRTRNTFIEVPDPSRAHRILRQLHCHPGGAG